ncbi:MAG: hypothetical protein V2G48_06430 [bacterium JZ-2024 1]
MAASLQRPEITLPLSRISPLLRLLSLTAFLLLPGAVNPKIPLKYQALYREMERNLSRMEQEPEKVRSDHIPVFAGELLPANGNRGDDLLLPETFAGCLLYLDALRSLGIQGVKVAIPYPLLDKRFAHSEDYLKFYQKISQEVRKRKMVLLVGMGTAFVDPNFSKIHWNYQKEGFSLFQQGRKEMILRVVRDIQPDYLTIANEPTTEALITGFSQLKKPETFADMVRDFLKGLPRGTAKIGAGAGNWESAEFIRKLLPLPLDYIDIHIYPIQPFAWQQARTFAREIRSSGKTLVVGEAWLYKVAKGKLQKTPPTEAFRRDAFSFWIPLDQKFIEVMAKWAQAEKIAFLSFFWSKYFFAYLDYNTQLDKMPFSSIRNLVDREVVKNLINKHFSPTGLFYKNLISHLPENTG